MPLLGQAAMLLTFDVADEAIAEHDDWHTHEHLPERMGIEGFLRGTRWVATGAGPRYAVLYEVERLATLSSPAYRERLEHPSPWTRRIMPHYRGMSRGFCAVECSRGAGMGHFALLVRFVPARAGDPSFAARLADDVVRPLPARLGLGSVHLLRGALRPEMTAEQRLRGTDAGVDWALLVTGYEHDAVAALALTELGPAALAAHGAAGVACATYRAAYALSAQELRAANGRRARDDDHAATP